MCLLYDILIICSTYRSKSKTSSQTSSEEQMELLYVDCRLNEHDVVALVDTGRWIKCINSIKLLYDQ